MPLKVPTRIDEHTVYKTVTTLDGKTHSGPWQMRRVVGNIGHAGVVMFTDGLRDIPFSSVLYATRP